MAISERLFRPSASASLAAGTASVSVALPGAGRWLRAVNASPALAFLDLHEGRPGTAGRAGIPISTGQAVLLQLPPTITHVAAVLAAGTGGIFLTQGEGAGC